MGDPDNNSAEIEIPSIHLSPSQLSEAIHHLLKPRYGENPKPMASVFVWGAMGIGKTDIVRQFAESNNARLIPLHLPQFDPTDLKGIPVKIDDQVKWVTSSYLPQQETLPIGGRTGQKTLTVGDYPHAVQWSVYVLDPSGKPIAWSNVAGQDDTILDDRIERVMFSPDSTTSTIDVKKPLDDGTVLVMAEKAVIFLDELSAADPATQNAALQLCLDRRINEYDVPFGVPVIAAGNREDDGAFVQQLSAPLANRFVHLTLVPNVKDFLSWAILNKVNPEVVGYIQWKGESGGNEVLFDYDPDRMVGGECGFPSPRSWAKLGEQLSNDLSTHVMNSIINGFIGKSVGSDFSAYRQVASSLPAPTEILNGNVTKVEAKPHVMYAIVTSLCYALKDVYDRIKPVENPGDHEWTTSVENALEFIMENAAADMCIMMFNEMLHTYDIEPNTMRCVAFDKFSSAYVSVVRQV